MSPAIDGVLAGAILGHTTDIKESLRIQTGKHRLACVVLDSTRREVTRGR
jgi:hypothetical protein